MKTPADQTHLQFFHKLFNQDKFKMHTGKIEYRVSDLDAEVARARRIVAAYKLNLEVVSDGNLATFKAFDVKEIAA